MTFEGFTDEEDAQIPADLSAERFALMLCAAPSVLCAALNAGVSDRGVMLVSLSASSHGNVGAMLSRPRWGQP